MTSLGPILPGLPASERLVFRCWTAADLPLAVALWGDAGVMRYMGGAMSTEEAGARMEAEMERQRTYGVQYWPIFHRATANFAGCAGLRPFHDEAGVFELGVHLAPAFWSERLGEEAARAVMRFAFEELGVEALTVGHFPANVHSRALAGGLGFQYTHDEPWGAHGTLHPYYRLARTRTSVRAAESILVAMATLETKRLGNSDMDLTRIGFGAWAIGGGDWAFAWGPQDDVDSVAAIQKALELGVNWIDTAAVYGLGHSEEVVARALEGAASSSGGKPYVFTKCGMVWNEKREIDRSLKQIKRECEDSLRRLKVDAIDLYQIHWPVPDEEVEEGWTAMAELQREGKVRWIGASNFSVAQMERAMKIAPVTSLQPPYSMINRGVEAEILPFCEARGIGVINYSPMHSGLLTGAMTKERVAQFPNNDFRKKAKNYQEPQLSKNLHLAELMKTIGARHGVSAGVVAIACTLHNTAVTAAIVGGRSAEQVEGVFPAASFTLPEEEFAEVQAFLAAAF